MKSTALCLVVGILLLALEGCGIKNDVDSLPSDTTQRDYYLSLKRNDYKVCYDYLFQPIKAAVSKGQFCSFMEETWHESWNIDDTLRVVQYTGPKLDGGVSTSFAIWTISFNDDRHQAESQSADIWVFDGANRRVVPACFMDMSLRMLPPSDIAEIVTNKLRIKDLK